MMISRVIRLYKYSQVVDQFEEIGNFIDNEIANLQKSMKTTGEHLTRAVNKFRDAEKLIEKSHEKIKTKMGVKY